MKKKERTPFVNIPPSIDEGIDMLEKASRVMFRPYEDMTGFILGNTAARMHLELLRRFKIRGYGVTPEQWVVLNSVAEHEGICQRDIAERTLKDRPTITRILDILESNGLITRRAGTDDRRMFNVFLTSEGKKNLDTFNAIVSEIDSKAFSNISGPELVKFKKTLKKIMDNIES